jgi:outer membrane protein TolC
MTLRQTVDRALEQNPDILLARFDQRTAQANVDIARDPFTPRMAVGSGLAYNNGFPLSIEGAAPSVFQAQVNQFLFNRQQTYTIARAREKARGAAIDSLSKQDEAVYRVAAAFFDAERTTRELDMARKQVTSLETVTETVRTRVNEGRELPLELKKAQLLVAKARQRAEALQSDQVAAEALLASLLGFEESDRVTPAADIRETVPLPPTEDEAVERALKNSRELRKIESDLIAEGLDIRAQKAARLPRVDLIAKYGLLARFNNYEDYFNTFKRHNALVGMSFQIPLLVGPAASALSAQAEINSSRLRVQRNSARSRISLDTRKTFRAVQEANTASDVARLDLDVTREQLSVLLAQYGEGRASLRQVEDTRFLENEKWIAFHEAQYALERARLDLLRQTGDLLAAIR